jgi:hypothetical protein
MIFSLAKDESIHAIHAFLTEECNSLIFLPSPFFSPASESASGITDRASIFPEMRHART